MKFSPKFESMYQAWQKAKDDDAKVLVLLSDPAYTRRFKLRGYNVALPAYRSPDVARKHYNELGFPTSKEAHRQRAAVFEALARELDAEHSRLHRLFEQSHGASGAFISGGFRDHWPEDAKNRMRFSARGSNILKDAAQVHAALAKSRSPAFT